MSERNSAEGIANFRSHRPQKSNISNDSFTDSSLGGPSCPKVYEEIIQGLEADVRKHIRIEHQLKLHIESVEDRIEELERDAAKLEENENKQKSDKTDIEEKNKKLEESIIKKIEIKYKLEKENLKSEIEKNHLKQIASKDNQLG